MEHNSDSNCSQSYLPFRGWKGQDSLEAPVSRPLVLKRSLQSMRDFECADDVIFFANSCEEMQ